MPRLRTWQLFAVCVGVWGTTWHAITYQLADLAAEYGVALRFAIAGAAVLAFALARGERLGVSRRAHAALALQGAFLYGVSYVCIYQAERFIASGLVAVGYSASPLLAGLGAAALFGAGLSARFMIGGVVGLVGVVLIFWPEIVRPASGERGALGAVLTVASVLLSAVGSLTASRNRTLGVPLLPALGFGMLYGALAAAATGVVLGRDFALPTATAWWLAMAWLSLAGSVIAYACFLTLQYRLGPGPAATVGIMTPLLALIVSLVFENFRPDLLTVVGAALAVAGNALMLRPRAVPRAGPVSASGSAAE